MEKDCFVKFNRGYYYIGSDAKEFLFVKYREGNPYAYFLDKDGQTTTKKCKLIVHTIDRVIEHDRLGQISFNYLIKDDDVDKIRFHYITEAFCQFLKDHKCPSLIRTSFDFAYEYFRKNIIDDPYFPKEKKYYYKFDLNPEIMNQYFEYDINQKYSSNPLNVFYYILLIYKFPIIFQKCMSDNLKFGKVKENLRNLIKFLLYVHEKEIKSIENNLAKLFVTEQIMKLESQDKSLFIVIYLLLTSNDIKKTSDDLMIFDSDSELKFLQGILPKNSVNRYNFWAFPAFLHVCNLTVCKNLSIEYRFSKQQDEIIDSVLKKWEDHMPKQGKKKFLGFSYGGSRVDMKSTFRSFFYDQEGLFKNNFESFNAFINEVNKKLPSKARQELVTIKKELKNISDNLSDIVKKPKEYLYEDLSISATEIGYFYQLIYKKSLGDPSAFWTVLNTNKLNGADLSTRRSIFNYINDCFTNSED